MCSVVNNLVTSLEVKPIRFATTLCVFRRIRNGYVATQLILLNITVESSVTSGYVVLPERLGQNYETASTNEVPARKKSNFVPSNGFNRSTMKTHVKHERYLSFIGTFLCILFNFGAFFSDCHFCKNHFDLLFSLLFIMSPRE